MKPPILTGEQVTGIVAKYIINDKPYPISELGERFGRALGEVIGTQRDKDYEHEQRTVREIFEEMEKRWKQYKYPLIAGTRKEETYFIFCSDNPEWETFKSRFLEEKPKEDS